MYAQTQLLSDLAALVGSRLCHDLISPIGAIGNGVELLALGGGSTGGETGLEMALLTESVAIANARVRFFRLAFGQSRAGAMVGRAEVISLLAELYSRGRLTVAFDAPPEFARCELKLALLLMMCAESALPSGGRVEIACIGPTWQITAQSPRLRPDGGPWALLARPDAGNVTPAQVQFALAGVESQRLMRPVTQHLAPDCLRLTF